MKMNCREFVDWISMGCDVFLREGGERLACHGSEFTIGGNVLQEPARTSLNNYEVKTEDNQVLVSHTPL